MQIAGAWPQELILLSGTDRSELLARMTRLRDDLLLAARPFSVIAERVSRGPHLRHRLAIAATDATDLLNKLESAQQQLRDPKKQQFQIRTEIGYADTGVLEPGKTIFLFPGQGSQFDRMFADLYAQLPSVRVWFDALDAGCAAAGFEKPSRYLFQPPDAEAIDQDSLNAYLYSMEGGAQAAFVGSLAVCELLRQCGVGCDAMLGHSNGENAALLAAEAIRFDDRADLIGFMMRLRAEAEKADSAGTIPQASVVAVRMESPEALEQALRVTPEVYIAADNCPHQAVIAGSPDVMETAAKNLSEAGGTCIPLPFGRAYHTLLFETKARHIRNELYNLVDVTEPRTPLYSCVSMDLFPSAPEAIRELAASLWCNRVRFRETILHLHLEGFRRFVEVGAGGKLAGFVRDTLRNQPHEMLPTQLENRGGVEQLLFVLGRLFLSGAEIDLSPLFGHRVDRAETIAGVVGCDLPPAETEKLQDLASSVHAEQPANALAMIRQHFALMNEFLTVQASVTQRTLSALRPAPALEARRGTSLPLLGSAMREQDGVFVWQTRLDTHNLPFLRDHVLGRIPSPRNSHLHALAVVPFTFSLEMLAEAAAWIDGGVAVAMGGIRALRWLALDQGFLTLEVEARRVPGERSIKVQIFELAQGGKERLKAFEGIVQMADRYERSPAAETLALEQPTSLRWSANDFYEYCLFHGKSLRSISEVVGLGELGIEAKLVAPDAETLFRDGQTGLQLSANLLDVMGQLVGYWLVERGAEFFGVFPVGGDAAQFFRGPVVRGERLTCRAKIARCGGYLEADFQFVDEKGDLACRVQGMRFGYYELPEKYLYAIYWPGTQTYLSQPWMEAQTDVLCRRLELASCAFFEDAAGIWKRALAHMTLTRTERDLWYSFGESGERRLDWLLGRIAAKECIRAFAARLGLELACADIEILPDERGKPVVRCAVWKLEGEIPQVSISHKEGVAMAALATHGGLIGLDLERLPRSGQHSLDLAFGDEEKALLAATAGGGDKLVLGCWCAKEAVAKAFGTGLKGTPDRWKVVSISEDARDLEVEHEGIVAGVRLFMNGNEVVAICNGTDPERVKHAESR